MHVRVQVVVSTWLSRIKIEGGGVQARGNVAYKEGLDVPVAAADSLSNGITHMMGATFPTPAHSPL